MSLIEFASQYALGGFAVAWLHEKISRRDAAKISDKNLGLILVFALWPITGALMILGAILSWLGETFEPK